MTAVLTHSDSDVLSLADLPADAQWVPAVIPGGVHESLMAAGLLADPYVDQNEDAARWVEDRTWWYRIPVPAPATTQDGGTVVLTLPSLDTVATVWFNGTRLGEHRNAFRPFTADVTPLVAADNEVVVRLAPPLEGLERPVEPQKTLDVLMDFVAKQRGGTSSRSEDLGLMMGDTRLTRLRKPTYSWGWDFAPRIASVGVLAAPELTARPRAALAGCHVRTVALDGPRAMVAVDVEASLDGEPLTVDVELVSPAGDVTACRLELEQSGAGPARGSAVVSVDDAQLWWTHDLGDPALYDVSVRLRRGDRVFDSTAFRTGLRTIELDRSPDTEEGRTGFRFVLNGVPVFARGSNWVPPSMLRGSVSPETVTELVGLARDGGHTMLRIWGGGAYEQDAFYDSCDELGVLVWQDFMFACFDYPSADPDLQREVALEAAHQVRRLRNHASIALWCGNNEVQVLHEALRGTTAAGDWGWHLFHALLPDVVRRESPGTTYWPGSAWGEDDPQGVNGPNDGDRHFWDVWHGTSTDPAVTAAEAMHWRRFLEDSTSFASEFGLQGAAHHDTLERWLAAPLDISSDAFLRRSKEGDRRKALRLAKHELGLVSTSQEYVDHTMACQAEGLKFGIEHYRRRQPHCGGTLVWQFNDSWPGQSWSLIDYDLKPKAAYYVLERAFRPVIASFLAGPERLELWVTNSSTARVELDLAVELVTADGTTSRRASVQHAADPHSSQVVWSAPLSTDEAVAHVAELTGALPPNRLFLGRLQDMPITGGTLRAEVLKQAGGNATVRLSAEGFCYFSRLMTELRGVVYSTNYVDLRDGEHVDVEVAGLPDGPPAGDVLRAACWGQPPSRVVVR